jgi:RimJ/RimL family protein N-acetyltransferase
MRWIGHASIKRESDTVYWAGIWISSRFGRYSGGFGAEAFELLRDYAVERLGAKKLTATNTDLERKAALEAAGFRLVRAFPAGHAKRRRGLTIRHYEWSPSP